MRRNASQLVNNIKSGVALIECRQREGYDPGRDELKVGLKRDTREYLRLAGEYSTDAGEVADMTARYSRAIRFEGKPKKDSAKKIEAVEAEIKAKRAAQK